MEREAHNKAISSRFVFFDVRMLVVLFLFFAAALLSLLALGSPIAVVAQVKGYNQPVVPIAAPKQGRINSEDRIEKSCTYLSQGAGTFGVNKSFELGTPQTSPSCFPAESTVQHTFNTGQTFTLHAFSGKYVQWQIPDSWITALDSGEIRQLVDITDMLYAHYAELVQGEPSGTGLLPISVNPEDTALEGLGCVGCKGIELSTGTLADFKRDIHVPAPGGWLAHEMGHNFDIYHDYLEYYDDGVHAWTSVVQFYLPYYGRWGDFLGGPDDELDRWLQKCIVPWDALGSGASWATCIRNGGGCEADGVTANDAWGGLVLRFARLHGTSAFRGVFDYLRDYKAAHPIPPDTPEAKNDLLVLALAAGAQLNIACELDTWHWEFSQTVRTQLAQNYPGQDDFCLDSDGDGFSRARGDLNDHNASIHPGAIEVTNGIDDDCDRVVDDIPVVEQTDFPSDVFQAPTIGSIPLRLTGHASSTDQDAVRVMVGSSLHLKAQLRSFEGLQGEFQLGSISGGGSSAGVFSFAPNTVTNFDADVPIGSDGLVLIRPASGSAGDYEIILDGTPPHPPDPIQLTISSTNTGSIHTVATVNLAPISGEQPTSIRFWANGVGFVQTLPASQTVSLDWTPPAGYCGFGVSAQLLAGDHPISAPSKSATLANISTRSLVQTGDNVMIGGFIVQGATAKSVIIRAIGPELGAPPYNIPGALADPTLELHNGTGALIGSNNNWQTTVIGGIITSNQVSAIQNSGHVPTDPRESAIIADLTAGNYTVIVRSANNTTGVALVEVYDVSSDNSSILGNISTRSSVQTDDNVMIGGFIVGGTESKTVIVRAIGPELGAPPYNVPGALADPTLELHDGTGALIASNDDWHTTIIGGIITIVQWADILNSGHVPGDGRESAIIATLQPGNYTAIVRGVGNTAGVALVEVYDLD